jgi:hypothetical protein
MGNLPLALVEEPLTGRDHRGRLFFAIVFDDYGNKNG